MGKNRIWYALLWVLLLWALIPIVHFDYDLLRLVFRRWTWGLLISPAADMFFALLSGSIAGPILMLLLIPLFFANQKENAKYNRRYSWTLLLLLGIVVGEFVIVTLMWGTFPLEVDAQNYIRLRMLPFIPWPDRQFLVFQ